jgi:hypothetical protein
MNDTRYKIWHWPLHATGDGSNVQFNVAILTKAKRSYVNQFEVPNELLCMRLGLALRLPIPVGVILEKDSQTYYASLHVAIAGEKLPPASEDDLDEIGRNEHLACGIVMFDSWILNEDRIPVNISHLEGQTFLFDHGRAFLDRTGRRFLEENAGNICIGHDHCLADRIRTLWAFDEWHQRIMDIPVGYIRDSVELASRVGLPPNEVEFCTQYLVERRERMREFFFRQRKQVFPNLKEDLFDPLGSVPANFQI